MPAAKGSTRAFRLLPSLRMQKIIRGKHEKGRDRYPEIYGPLLPYVKILQQRGYVVTSDTDGYHVGHKTLNHHGLIDMALREQRLAATTVFN